MARISPIGPAIHGDFYAIAGAEIPADALTVFRPAAGGNTENVVPDLIRPHWAFVGELPTHIAPGRYFVSLQTATWQSDEVHVKVFSTHSTAKRAIYSGPPKPDPYTIAFVANPKLQKANGQIIPDPITRSQYHDAVVHCTQNLLTVAEDVLRVNDHDAHIRFVSIMADGPPLVYEVPLSNTAAARGSEVVTHLASYGEVPDVALIIHGSTTHTRASAFSTADDMTRAGTPYTFDGDSRQHWHFSRRSGCAAISVYGDRSGLTVLHEFAHAASGGSGHLGDLYHDGNFSDLTINKKKRVNATDPVPADFCTFDGEPFQSDPNRDGFGYPNSWRSYHPSLIDSSRPNLMDNYWFADQPQMCRLDQLSYDWLRGRLAAKMSR